MGISLNAKPVTPARFKALLLPQELLRSTELDRRVRIISRETMAFSDRMTFPLHPNPFTPAFFKELLLTCLERVTTYEHLLKWKKALYCS